MQQLVPMNALPGRSRSINDQLARGLGYFSIALGLAELLAPRMITRTLAMPRLEPLVRSYGAREIATGVAILGTPNAAPWIWGRVAGDVLDIATVAIARRPRSQKTSAVPLAMAALLAVTAVDLLCARDLEREKGSRRTAISNYGDRSGFPGGVQAAHGAARDSRPATAQA